MNLTYLNVTLTGKVQRWKLYLQDKDFHLCHVPGKEVHQFHPNALSRLCDNYMPTKEGEKPAHSRHQAFLASIEPKHRIPDAVFKQIAKVYNSIYHGCRRSNIPSSQRTNQEVMRHLRAMLFDARVHDKWSYEQLPMVQLPMVLRIQRIMNSKKRAYKQVGDSGGTKDSTGVPVSALKHSASSFIDHWTKTSLRSTPSLQVIHKDGKNMIDKVLEGSWLNCSIFSKYLMLISTRD